MIWTWVNTHTLKLVQWVGVSVSPNLFFKILLLTTCLWPFALQPDRISPFMFLCKACVVLPQYLCPCCSLHLSNPSSISALKLELYLFHPYGTNKFSKYLAYIKHLPRNCSKCWMMLPFVNVISFHVKTSTISDWSLHGSTIPIIVSGSDPPIWMNEWTNEPLKTPQEK